MFRLSSVVAMVFLIIVTLHADMTNLSKKLHMSQTKGLDEMVPFSWFSFPWFVFREGFPIQMKTLAMCPRVDLHVGQVS